MSYCFAELTGIDKKYHDQEWGVPVHRDKKQFEYLMMEVLQCGLSWSIVLHRREVLRKCFDNFDYDKIAQYTEKDVERIMKTEGMIRSKPKILAIIHNAKCFQEIRKEFGSFSKYLWNYSDGKVILYNHHGNGEIPVSNGLSDEIAKDLKKRGFKFIGSITIYSHLQASGIINDHHKQCVCYKRIVEKYPTIRKKRYLEVR